MVVPRLAGEGGETDAAVGVELDEDAGEEGVGVIAVPVLPAGTLGVRRDAPVDVHELRGVVDPALVAHELSTGPRIVGVQIVELLLLLGCELVPDEGVAGLIVGLDVHDVGNKYETMKAGMVFTCEPGIYIPEENLGIRIENNILITTKEPIDLMSAIPIEVEDIEEAMREARELRAMAH